MKLKTLNVSIWANLRDPFQIHIDAKNGIEGASATPRSTPGEVNDKRMRSNHGHAARNVSFNS